MGDSNKRKHDGATDEPHSKKSKALKGWRVPKKSRSNAVPTASGIEAGDTGIFVTCVRGQEGRATAELRDLFNDYAEKLYALPGRSDGPDATSDDEFEEDIEAGINSEIQHLKASSKKVLFQPVRIDIKCVLFFKTQVPVEPVSFVHRICSDASQGGAGRKSTRYVNRLTPMSLMGKATEKGVEDIAKEVLTPHFLGQGTPSKKFAIRTTIRNHTVLDRDTMIKQVADIVGSSHTVDLTHPDLVILVDVYKNVCGMSVVAGDYDSLKRFNLAEITKTKTETETKTEPDHGASAARQ